MGLLVTCGKQEGNINRVNPHNPYGCQYGQPGCTTGYPPGNYPPGHYPPGHYPPGGGGHPGDIMGTVNRIIQSAPCLNGEQRWFPHLSYISRGGQLVQQAHVPSQGVWYLGENYGTKDLIFLQEVPQGLGVTGYNVILSFCTERNRYSGRYRVGPGVVLSNLYLTGVIVDHSLQCGLKKVSATVSFASSASYTPIHVEYAPIRQCWW